MKPSDIRKLVGIMGGAALALVAQLLWIPGADEVLKSARSEITRESIERRWAAEDAARTNVPMAETQPTRRALRDEAAVVSARVAEQPAAPRGAATPAATLPGRRSALPWYRLWAAALARARSEHNRATNTATPATLQLAPAQEAMAVVADPVNGITGEMTLDFPIITVEGPGLNFSFSLSYRSDFDYDGPIGRRWEHNWNARFELSGSDLTRMSGNRVDVYPHLSGDDHASPFGFTNEKSITKYYDGTHNRVERRLKDGTLEIYKELGPSDWYFLTEVQHRDSDNAIALAYDGSQQHRLTKITDTRGKDYKFGYDSNARITAFEDWSAGGGSPSRAWGFEYDGADLVTIVDPVSKSTAFTYMSTSLLESIKAPREVAEDGPAYLVNTYDTSSPKRVSLQQLGAGTYKMDYDAGMVMAEDRAGGVRLLEYNGSYEITKIRQSLGGGNWADTTYAWNGAAQITKVTYPEGNGIQYRYDSDSQLTAMIQCAAAGIGSTDSPSTLRSSGDHVVTEYVYQTTANWNLVTKIKDPVGSDWFMARDGTGNVTTYKTPQHPSDPYVIGYDGNSRVTSLDDPEGRGVAYVYGATGTLTQVVVDPGGGGALALATTMQRDVFENVTKVIDPEGRETTQVRNELGLVTKVTSPEGAETDYLYDRNQALTEVRTDVGIAGLNAERVVKYDRNIMDLVTSMREAYGGGSWRTTSYAYDEEDRVTEVTLPESARKVAHVYDMRGLEITRTTAAGTGASSSEPMAYDKNGRLTSRKDGLNNATILAYDGFDRLTKTTDAAGHYQTTTFDKNGNVVQTSAFSSGDVELARTATEYDLDNRLTKTKRYSAVGGSPATVDTTYVFDKSGKLVTKVDGCGCGGGDVVYFHDTAGRLTKVVDAATNEVVYAFDKSGLTTKVTSLEKESGPTKTYVVEYAFNDDRHLTAVSERGGGSDTAHTTTFQVDDMGRTTKTIDANSNEVRTHFDDLGRVTKIERGVNGDLVETRAVFDLNDNVLEETSERGDNDATTTYVYDAADRMSIMKDESDTAVKTLVYDDAHNVITMTDGNGTVAVLTYDARNLLTRVDYDLATNVVGPILEKFWYDGLGRVTAAINQRADEVDERTYDARVERTWNLLGKLSKEKTWINPEDENGDGSTPREVEYVYDASGRLSIIKYPDLDGGNRTQVRHTYDAINRVTSITRQDPGTGGWTAVASWEFQGPSRMTLMTFGNGVKETMAYDEYGRPTMLEHDRPNTSTTREPMYAFKRTYDAGNRVVKERRDYHDNGGTILDGEKDFGDIYVYDHQNRLVTTVRSVGYVGGNHTLIDAASDTTTNFYAKARYTLDPGGNRQTLTYDIPFGGGSVPFLKEEGTFNIENELTLETTYLYDISESTWFEGLVSAGINYDANGNHVSSNPTVKVDAHNRIYESGTWRYRYDPFGRRIEKRDTDGAYWRRCYYDGIVCVGEWFTELDEGVPTESASGPMWLRIFGPYLVDQLIWAKLDACGTCGNYASGFLHLDYLGSTVMATNGAPNGGGGYDIVETYRYDEYGQPYFRDAAGGALTASAYGNDYLYTGRQWDPEMGLYYYRARYYDQSKGRFLGRDPARADGTGNMYSYVNLDPAKWVDSLGLQPSVVGRCDWGEPVFQPEYYSDYEVDPSKIDFLPCSFYEGRCPPGKYFDSDCCARLKAEGQAELAGLNRVRNDARRDAVRDRAPRPNPNVPWMIVTAAGAFEGFGLAIHGGVLWAEGGGAFLGFAVTPWGGAALLAGGALMAVAHFTLFEHYKNQVIMPSPETVAEANRKWTEAYCTHSSESGRRGHAYDPRVYAECCKPLFGPGGLFPDGWPGGRPRGCVQVGGVFVFFGSNGGPIQAEDEDEKPK